MTIVLSMTMAIFDLVRVLLSVQFRKALAESNFRNNPVGMLVNWTCPRFRSIETGTDTYISRHQPMSCVDTNL